MYRVNYPSCWAGEKRSMAVMEMKFFQSMWERLPQWAGAKAALTSAYRSKDLSLLVWISPEHLYCRHSQSFWTVYSAQGYLRMRKSTSPDSREPSCSSGELQTEASPSVRSKKMARNDWSQSRFGRSLWPQWPKHGFIDVLCFLLQALCGIKSFVLSFQIISVNQ